MPWPPGGASGHTAVMSHVRIEHTTVARGPEVLLDAVDLDVASGERVAILGASGAGKSTLLRLIAGLEAPVAGRVLIDEIEVTHLPPAQRGVAMLFPRGGLQPHLRVRDNLALPLRVRHRSRREVARRVAAEARAFTIDDLLDRRPATLAGGQRQVVGLARSLVHRRGVLLADEPVTGLDARQRAAVLRELLTVQEGYGTTLLVATNDPTLALTLAHRVAVLDHGRLEQIGTPEELAARPATRQVADLATPWPLVVLPGRVVRVRGRTRIIAPPLLVTSHRPEIADLAGEDVVVGVSPQAVTPTDAGDERRGTFDAQVTHRAFLGAEVQATLTDARGASLVAVLRAPGPDLDAWARFRVDPAQLHLFTPHGPALAHGV